MWIGRASRAAAISGISARQTATKPFMSEVPRRKAPVAGGQPERVARPGLAPAGTTSLWPERT